jgi:hypothetical protein
MPSPFPGMDPYLEHEKHWPAFQHQLVLALYQSLLPSLGDRYRARIGTRHYLTEQVLFTSVLREEHHEEYLEVRLRSDGRLVTLLDFVSPANRTTPRGRVEYLNQRQAARNVGANLVEVDLVLQGTPLLDGATWDYGVLVTRATSPDKQEGYTAQLAAPLPRFKVPLGRNDRDLVLDLGILFCRAFEQGAFGGRIDYAQEPKTKLRDSDREWVEVLLRGAKLREA